MCRKSYEYDPLGVDICLENFEKRKFLDTSNAGGKGRATANRSTQGKIRELRHILHLL